MKKTLKLLISCTFFLSARPPIVFCAEHISEKFLHLSLKFQRFLTSESAREVQEFLRENHIPPVNLNSLAKASKFGVKLKNGAHINKSSQNSELWAFPLDQFYENDVIIEVNDLRTLIKALQQLEDPKFLLKNLTQYYLYELRNILNENRAENEISNKMNRFHKYFSSHFELNKYKAFDFFSSTHGQFIIYKKINDMILFDAIPNDIIALYADHLDKDHKSFFKDEQEFSKVLLPKILDKFNLPCFKNCDIDQQVQKFDEMYELFITTTNHFIQTTLFNNNHLDVDILNCSQHFSFVKEAACHSGSNKTQFLINKEMMIKFILYSISKYQLCALLALHTREYQQIYKEFYQFLPSETYDHAQNFSTEGYERVAYCATFLNLLNR